jgi:hypothetical protein
VSRRGIWAATDDAAFFYAMVSFSTPELSDLLYVTTHIGQVFSRGCCSEHRRTWPRDGLIWPKTGCASIA